MNLEVLAWAPSNKEWEQAITTTMVMNEDGEPEPLAAYAYDMNGVQVMPPRLVPHAGLNIDEIGPIPAVYGPPPEGGDIGEVGDIIKEEAVGHHVNLRFHEPLADKLIGDLPQTDGEGNLLPLFERTHLLELFPGANWDTLTGPAPPGYIGPKGLKLFDPASVLTRHRIWA